MNGAKLGKWDIISIKTKKIEESEENEQSGREWPGQKEAKWLRSQRSPQGSQSKISHIS
jgi:hypothetical protein